MYSSDPSSTHFGSRPGKRDAETTMRGGGRMTRSVSRSSEDGVMSDCEFRYQLLPDQDLYLCSDRDDGQYLVDSFRRVWQRLPINDRDALLRHWTLRKDASKIESIIIAYLVDQVGSGGDFAQALDQGHELCFERMRFIRGYWSLGEIDDRVAHELAHVMLLVEQEPDHVESFQDDSPC
jgi:hypothetical protein